MDSHCHYTKLIDGKYERTKEECTCPNGNFIKNRVSKKYRNELRIEILEKTNIKHINRSYEIDPELEDMLYYLGIWKKEEQLPNIGSLTIL